MSVCWSFGVPRRTFLALTVQGAVGSGWGGMGHVEMDHADRPGCCLLSSSAQRHALPAFVAEAGVMWAVAVGGWAVQAAQVSALVGETRMPLAVAGVP